MLFGALARFTDTPKFRSGMKAYDIVYMPPDEHGNFDTVVTYGNQTIGDQIRRHVYANHPDSTDYTFREIDYLAFQMRSATQKITEMAMMYVDGPSRQSEELII